MKCRKGDIAFVTIGYDIGKIVQCIDYLGSMPRVKKHSDLWKVDKPIKWKAYDGAIELVDICPDKYLIPIRDSDDEDEMLRLIGYPNETVKVK